MLKHRAPAGLLVGLLALILIAATPASAYLYKKPAGKDCGQVIAATGFGGPGPSNVPANARPRIDTFIIRGKISCKSAKHVMASFERSFSKPGAGTKGTSPSGWKCAFSKKAKGNECTNSSHVAISNGIVYLVGK